MDEQKLPQDRRFENKIISVTASFDPIPQNCSVSIRTHIFSANRVLFDGLWDTGSVSSWEYHPVQNLTFANIVWTPSTVMHEPNILNSVESTVLSFNNVTLLCVTNCSIAVSAQLQADRNLFLFNNVHSIGVGAVSISVDISSKLTPHELVITDSSFDGPLILDPKITQSQLTNFTIENTTLSAGLVQRMGLPSTRITRSIFTGDVTFEILDLSQNNVNDMVITNCSFLNGSRISLPILVNTFAHPNVVIRYNRFEPSSVTDGIEDTAVWIFSSMVRIDVDARANWWGDAAGPYSCCRPLSKGRFLFGIQSASWCLDEECQDLSVPLGSTDHLVGARYRPLVCELETMCTPIMDFATFLLGGLAAATMVIAWIAVLISRCCSNLSDNNTDELMEDNIAPAFFNRRSEEPSIKPIVILAVASIVIDLGIIGAAWTPIFYTQPFPRLTSDANEIIKWSYISASFGTGASVLKLISNIWLLIVLARGKPHKSLVGNTIFGAVTSFIALVWRLTNVVNSFHLFPLGTTAFTQSAADPHVPELALHTSFFWMLWGSQALTQIFFSIPIAVMNLRIIANENLSEIEMIKTAVAENKLVSDGSALHSISFATTTRKLSTANIVFAVLTFLFGGFSLMIGLSQNILSPLAFTVATVLAVGVLILIFGFFTLRYRYYEITRGLLFISLLIGVIIIMGELALSRLVVWSMSISFLFISAGALLLLDIGLFVIAILTAKVYWKMRTELAASVATAVYERLEDALSYN